MDSETNLVVLEAERYDTPGNGKTTCTLCQKGDNYDFVEAEKEKQKEEAVKDYTLKVAVEYDTTAFWGYRDQIKNITFQDSINIPNGIMDGHKWDVSETGNGKVMAYITPNSSDSSYYDLYIQGDGELYANSDSSRLFSDFYYVDSINNIELLDTRNVTNMSGMFSSTGYISQVFTLDLGDKFDTSNVTDMYCMFLDTGYNSKVFTLDLGDKFDTSNVTDMHSMFAQTGYISQVFTLDLGDKFDTSNVTNMHSMFDGTGANSTSNEFTLDVSGFDTGNVTDMSYMFRKTGNYNSDLIIDCSSWNVNKVVFYKSFCYGNCHKVKTPVWVNADQTVEDED